MYLRIVMVALSPRRVLKWRIADGHTSRQILHARELVFHQIETGSFSLHAMLGSFLLQELIPNLRGKHAGHNGIGTGRRRNDFSIPRLHPPVVHGKRHCHKGKGGSNDNGKNHGVLRLVLFFKGLGRIDVHFVHAMVLRVQCRRVIGKLKKIGRHLLAVVASIVQVAVAQVRRRTSTELVGVRLIAVVFQHDLNMLRVLG
mmetsp:Transcript_2532/g.6372  ORF Transcript_2532/g.6372 Transcript_2532/m.6372 type:complete len:200 (+) Transcript_2532:912-1511(+)